jgi:hypothetical protein
VGYASWMHSPCQVPCLKGFRSVREIIAYAVWAYHRFALSTADVEDLLAERGVIISREAIRLWVNRFGRPLQIVSGEIGLRLATSGTSTRS